MEDNVPPFGLSVNEWSFYQYVLASPKGTKFTDRPESMDVQDAYIAMNSLLKKVLSFFFFFKKKIFIQICLFIRMLWKLL